MTDKIILSLTKEQAEVLSVILSRIGGNSRTTARGRADEIQELLYDQKAGATVASDIKYPIDDKEGVIWFI